MERVILNKISSVLFSVCFVLIILSSCNFTTSCQFTGEFGKNQSPFSTAADSNYTTYFGSPGAEDATKVTFDNEGNTLLIGQSESDDMPTTEGVIQEERTGDDEAYIAKFAPSGELIFCTYLGGHQYEHITSVTTDSENNIVVAGTTMSLNFPVTDDAYQSNNAGSFDGFLTKISSDGTELLYSTYFGTDGVEWIYGVEFDDEGNYMFAGWTTGNGQATSGAFQTTNAGGQDVFIARLSADGATLELFSYYGGTSNDRESLMIVDSSYNYVVAGVSYSDDLPGTDKGEDSSFGGDSDAYVVKIAYEGTSVIFSNYIGGSEEDFAISCDIDSAGNIIVSGFTESDDLTIVDALQSEYGGGLWDIHIAKFSSIGEIEFITYLGGNKSDRAWEVRADLDDDIFVAGRTYSDNYPILNATHPTRSGNEDGCLTKISSDGQSILVSTYLGGSSNDNIEGMAVDGEGHVVVTGRTTSDDLVVSNGAYQDSIAGSADAFICHSALDFVSETSSTTDSTLTDVYPIDTNPILIVVIGISSVAIIVIIVLRTGRRSGI